MAHSAIATSKTPATIVYLLDMSLSMRRTMDGRRKLDLVLEALDKVMVRMVQRSTKGVSIAPRYRIAIYGYHTDVVDLLGGIKPIGALAEVGIPPLHTEYGTQTARAFRSVEKLLSVEIPRIQDHPAPLVCHMTDGLYGGEDPAPVAARIQQMSVIDGPVLVENIFLSKSVFVEPMGDPEYWPGITAPSQLQPMAYVQQLYAMSSLIPDSYLSVMEEFGYSLKRGARMLFPGDSPGIVELGFAMSGATPVVRPEQG